MLDRQGQAESSPAFRVVRYIQDAAVLAGYQVAVGINGLGTVPITAYTIGFGVLLVAILSVGRGTPSAELFGRRIPHLVVYRSLAVALLAAGLVFSATIAVEAVTHLDFIAVLFETVSAFGTVGLTTGITPELPDAALLILVGVMYVGRLGPLVFVLALAARARPVAHRPASETLRIG